MGTLIKLHFPLTMKLLDLFRPKSSKSTINIKGYNEPTHIDKENIQLFLTWIYLKLVDRGYCGQAHLFWYDRASNPELERLVKKMIHRNEPIFLFCYGHGEIPLPQGYYWQAMEKCDEEMRLYQLEEVKDE